MAAPNNWGSLAVYCVINGFDSAVPTAEVEYDSELGVYRFREYHTGLWLVNSAGHFPYYKETTNTEDTGSSPTLTYSWWFRSDIATGTAYSIVPESDLRTIAKQYSGNVKQVGNYYVILDVTTSKILCASGHPLAAIAKLESTAVGTTNNYYTQEGDTVYNEYQGGDTIINEGDQITNNVTNNNITNNSTTVYEGGDTYNNQFIDIEDNSIHLQDGSIYNIDNLWYDETTQSYYVDSHDEYVYNSTTNEYTTNNFLFQISYHVNYTSITYIGQTEEFEADTYVYYYELPDGRSSADLTAEDLEQLSLVFHDVVNYARTTDAGDLRGLYHFDGNTEDSSYWSYCTSFDWDYGGSLTYMDEGVFNGSLYLDEQSHLFYITLPNKRDLAGDFTIQFRYYQSEAKVSSLDCCISLDAPLKNSIFQFSGKNFALPDDTEFYPTHIGSWNEICIMRVDGVLHYYINGVYIALTYPDSTIYSDKICFYFHDDQQCFRKIDELRITRGAVYTPGVDYSPTAVPFDTNLAFVLPDGGYPLADEALVWTPSSNNLLTSEGLDDWTESTAVGKVKAAPSEYASYFSVDHPFVSAGMSLYKNSTYTSLSCSGQSTSMQVSSSNAVSKVYDTNGEDYNYLLAGGLFFPLFGYYKYTGNIYAYFDAYCNVSMGVNYCLSVLLSDGTYEYIVFKITEGAGKGNSSTYATISTVSNVSKSDLTLNIVDLSDYYLLSNGEYYTWYNYGVSISCPVNAPVDIVYMELVEGSSPEFTIDWETAMYSSGELEESPVLAVRSNTPISTYTFGGVRPTYPDRGQVWAMIEGSRIVSLQQYTGSAWVEVDGRIWTGHRWIPYSSFDVFTLQDCWDVMDSGESDDYEYIYSESGFWAWWQRQWNQFTKSLFAALDKIASSSGGGDVSVSIENNTLIDADDKKPLDKNDYKSIVKTMRRSLDFVFGFFDGFVTDGLNGFFDIFDDSDNQFFGLFRLEGLGG